LPTITNSRQEAIENIDFSLPDLSKTRIRSSVNVDPPRWLNVETLALSENPASKPAAAGGDGAEQARLFGIYTGQIQARIDRVWRRPRAPLNDDTTPANTDASGDSFRCEAQIVQDARGNVQEILLPRCNGSAAWQRSLVLAIQQASPLPAPPSIKVFTQSITLNFLGLPYVQGASSEEYEIVPLARMDQ
jgi:outer membrane biosynthesis protein TonB